MPGKLTSAGIGNLKRLGKFYDGTHGLFLQVYPSGAKCWQQRLTVSGRRRTFGLGGFPAVGLADARAAACKNWLLRGRAFSFLVTADRGARSSSRWVSAPGAPSRSGGFLPRSSCCLPLPLVLVAAGQAGTDISGVASPAVGDTLKIGPERIRLALRGHDVPARVSVRRSVAHGRVLTGPARCWRAARPIVRWLAVCALHRCGEGGQAPRRVRLEVATTAAGPHVVDSHLRQLGVERELLRVVSAQWDRAARSAAGDVPVRVAVPSHARWLGAGRPSASSAPATAPSSSPNNAR